MHNINPGTESEYKIVQCEDPSCNICTSALADGYGMPPSPPDQGIVVYTCSNPSCSLCDGDYSLLLDIVYPTVSPQEDWVLMQEQRCSQMTSLGKRASKSLETKINHERTGLVKRKYSDRMEHTAAKVRRPNDGVINKNDDLINNVDDNQLMNLAIELELDKIDCLPDLQKDVITELKI